MTISLMQQTEWFAIAVLIGAGFGLFFQLETLLGNLLGLHRTGRFFLDVCCFALYAAVSYLYLLTFLNGELRFYPLLGMGLGAGLWFAVVKVCGKPVLQVRAAIRDKTRKEKTKTGKIFEKK